MTALEVFKLLLTLAAFVARRLDKAQVEQAVLNALQIDLSARDKAAGDAHGAVTDGRVPVDPDDPYRRD